MNLPPRILEEAPSEPVLSVDGAFDAPGLNLSHWPGNSTPPQLKHDLSLGIVFNFVQLPKPEQERLSADCTAIVNNHYDSDGVLSMFTLLEPQLALKHHGLLLDTAYAGDFYYLHSEEAFILDSILTAFGDPERSPHAQLHAGLNDLERRQLATEHALEALPGILTHGNGPFESLWRGPLDALHADQRDLEQCDLDDLVHLDYVVRCAPHGFHSTRQEAPDLFDPGRHALWGHHKADRQLVLGPGPLGCTCRLLIGTRSFFELATGRAQPRPDLGALAHELNSQEGTQASDALAWRWMDPQGGSPELWFGKPDMPAFTEFAGLWLAHSSLPMTTLKSCIVDAVRATWVWPEEEDTEAAGSSQTGAHSS